MAFRTFLLFVCIYALSACKNEPYPEAPLGVTTVADHGSGQTSTFTYRNFKLSTFFKRTSADTLADLKFRYLGGELKFITIDSTDSSYNRAWIYYMGDVVTDSTFYYDIDTTKLVGIRTITYDPDRNPVSVTVKRWVEDEEGIVTNTEDLAELTWENGNAVTLTTRDLTSSELPAKVTGFTYDDQLSIYMDNMEYIYTLNLDELHWLSNNNPLTFEEEGVEKELVYQYNRLGYPSTYTKPDATTVGVSYTQVR